jgi:hypothetical protein
LRAQRTMDDDEKAAMPISLPFADDVKQAMAKLKSLHDGDLGVLAVTACGSRAVPALQALLFERERSGLYQPRYRAIDALAAMRAYDVLFEFLRTQREALDPVERFGDEAVINAAAMALSGLREERVFQLLLKLAERRSQPGVTAALAKFRRTEAIPYLIRALDEDTSRRAAETALRRLGRPARRPLLEAATRRPPNSELESESDRRRRRAALRLLADIGVPKKDWRAVRPLLNDADHKIAVLACKIFFVSAPIWERTKAVRRLIALLPEVEWMLAEEIEDCLAAHFESARDIVEVTISKLDRVGEDDSQRKRILRALLRIRKHAQSGRN